MANTVYQLGGRRELFVDGELLMDMGGARLCPHAPVARENVLFTDTPADGGSIGYPTVFREGGVVKLYYLCYGFAPGAAPDYPPLNTDFGMEEGEDESEKPAHSLTHWPHAHIGYAESADGVNFIKPSIKLFDFNGSCDNHIVYMLPGDMLDNFSAGLDTNPDCPDGWRYKALCERVVNRRAVLNALVSPDGINWTDLGTVITVGTFDTLNTWFWDAEAGLYRAYMRTWLHHYPSRNLGESGVSETTTANPSEVRSISTSTSPDFINWSEPVDLCYGAAPEYQMYTNNVLPYYRAPHIYMGFPTRYYEREWSPVFGGLPDAEDRRARAAKMTRAGTALTDALFMTSRDGVNFKRWDYPAFLPAGIERSGNWCYGDGYLAYGIIETPAEGGGAELSMYAYDCAERALRRYTMRLDGFVSLRADSCASALTRPFTFEGGRLMLNYTTSVAGGIKIELLDEHMNPIPGYSLEECDLLIGDTTCREVTWGERADVSALAGRVVHMRINMGEADLYSLKFEP